MLEMPEPGRRALLSIVIATYQGEGRIMTALQSLAKQTFKDFETIVVIDGSTDNTEQLISENHRLSNLQIIVQKNKGRAGARNAGVLKASGNAILFFDDDVEVPPPVVEKYLALFKTGKAVMVGSLYPVQKIQNEFFDYMCYLTKKWTVEVDQSKAGAMTKPYITACNFFISKQVFEKMGGFNPVLRDAEDFDLAVRLFEAGEPIYFVSEISIGHTIQSNFRHYAKRLKEYAFAQVVLHQQNPAAKKYSPGTSSIAPYKKLIFRLFAAGFLLKAIDLGYYKILPTKFRFKLYDIILTAHSLKKPSLLQ
jgi:GT2 family glycosyltransferase